MDSILLHKKSGTGFYCLFQLEYKIANFNPPSWYGGKTENGDIVLTRPQQAPGSGTPGTNRLTFSNISEEGFDWIGEWISEDESVVYPYWRIYCKKDED